MKKSDIKGAILWGSLSVLMLLFIYGQSLLPPDESSEVSGTFLAFLLPILDPFGWFSAEAVHIFIRKAAHFAEYALFSVFFTNFCWKTGIKNVLLPLLVSLFVAATDELLQRFTGRGSRASDVLLDYSGAFFGFGVLWLVSRKSLKKENENEA